MLLNVDKVSIAYHGNAVVRDVSFHLDEGRIGCLLGPSGCGKTTLLRAIAGFEPLLSGGIELSGRTVSAAGVMVPPEQRAVGMVFQDFALFTHLTVADNIGFGVRRWSAAERKARVHELLQLVEMSEYGAAYPHQLSGGQQQRIALARALAPRPRLLLLDEPFSSLDVELRVGIAREVARILRHEGLTAILVTHDQMEAFAMADEIGVLEEGRLLQWDSGYNLYHRPANRFVARFVGQGTLLSGTVIDEHQVSTALGVIHGRETLRCAPGSKVDVLIRPDDLVSAAAQDTAVSGLIQEKDFRGAEYLYTLRLDNGEQVVCLARSHETHAIGERIGLRLDSKHMIVFPR